MMAPSASLSNPSLAPTTLVELQDSVRAAGRLLPRGGGTKPALSTPPDGVQCLELRGLSGILEYNPGEYTITALAGTPLQEVAEALAAHGQHLPFDPPLARAGATLGGTVAAGLSGSGRYRYGGLRDFIIGVRLVDGLGRLVRGGGKVVKNAAGFDLPKLMVGSLGRLGILAEVSFKVFPAPPAHATLRVSYAARDDALASLDRLRLSHLDLIALDLVPDAPGAYHLFVRIGGPAAVLPARLATLRNLLGDGESLTGDPEAAHWHEQAAFTWVEPDRALVKVPLSPHQLAPLDAALASAGADRRYLAGGSMVWVAWPGALPALGTLLAEQGLAGLVLRGESERPLIGAPQDRVFLSRITAALDPEQRFPQIE
ncbi:MAG TPA: FAD-binding protein [Caldilineaceae bacterium]|nr:FAD-binding protein [Caldilineaceae bacterium]